MEGILEDNGAVCDRLAVLTMVSDNGKKKSVSISNLINSDISAEHIRKMYPKGAMVRITDAPSGNAETISVKNPAKVHVRTHFPTDFVTTLHEISLAALRENGKALFNEGKFEAALEIYTRFTVRQIGVLDIKSKEDKRSLLIGYSNRAQCLLKLERFEEAGDKAAMALNVDPELEYDPKSLFRLGKAMFHQQEYDDACVCFNVLAEILGPDTGPEIHGYLKKAEKAKLFQKQKPGRRILRDKSEEVSEYLGPVEIRLTRDGKGRGLFATKDIREGEVVIVSTAVAAAGYPQGGKHDKQELFYELTSKLVRACRNSRLRLRQLYTLQDSPYRDTTVVPPMHLFGPNKRSRGYERKDAEDEKLEIDVKRIRNIAELQGITFQEPQYDTEISSMRKAVAGLALHLVPGFINHSCLPNMRQLDSGPKLLFQAIRDIQAGEELTYSYCLLLQPLCIRFRKRDLQDWTCKCYRCQLESGSYERKLSNPAKVVYKLFKTRLLTHVDDVNVAMTLAEIVPEVEEAIKDAPEKEQHCIRASYAIAYAAYVQLERQEKMKSRTKVLKTTDALSSEVIKAINYSIPGDELGEFLVDMLRRRIDLWA